MQGKALQRKACGYGEWLEVCGLLSLTQNAESPLITVETSGHIAPPLAVCEMTDFKDFPFAPAFSH